MINSINQVKVPNSKQVRFVLGILGRSGYGKSTLAREIISKIHRKIIIDPKHEYHGLIVERPERLIYHVKVSGFSRRMNIVYRPHNEIDFEVGLSVMQKVQCYTLIAEEADKICDPHQINPAFKQITAWGRHDAQSMIWIARSPFEVNPRLREQADVIVSFRQDDLNAVRYMNSRGFDRDVSTLDKFEYATWGEVDVIKKLIGKAETGAKNTDKDP